MGNTSSVISPEKKLIGSLRVEVSQLTRARQALTLEKKKTDDYMRLLEIGSGIVSLAMGTGFFLLLQSRAKSQRASKDLLLKLKTLQSETMISKENAALRIRGLEADVKKAKKFAISSFSKDLLDVADNLGRFRDETVLRNLPLNAKKALLGENVVTSAEEIFSKKNSVLTEASLVAVLEAVSLTEGALEKVLSKHGVVKYDDVEGETSFDPDRHEALFQDKNVHKGILASIERAGYELNGRVLRAARVSVGSLKEEDKLEKCKS